MEFIVGIIVGFVVIAGAAYLGKRRMGKDTSIAGFVVTTHIDAKDKK